MIENITKDKKTGRLSVTFKNTTPAFVNTIRRAAIDLVPTMAIDEVNFVQNSSAMYDEVIAHRLGLLVLKTDLKGYNLPEECTCKGEGCAKCQTTLKLKVKGPGIAYASDIKSTDPKIKPEYPKTPIIKLLKDQVLEFQATAKLGRGKTHVKHTPCLAWHTFKAKATVNNNHKEFEKFKDKYPKEIFTKDGKIDPKLIEKHDLYDACDGINENIVKIEYDPTTITLHIEPWGQLTAKEILLRATDEITRLFTEFEEQIK
ncbi:MAG TPA: DNA-directed RNA polymerase subunit D [Candidatus Woesearchaeota archaeon]|nr:MAG: DNA-directed RNA polymerase subunit D [Candidatus Woesearchaeota archaeon]HDD70585.1 DNA-directed RNA polymerase subunit D [Candidatus Woesearchaeota archaeon]